MECALTVNMLLLTLALAHGGNLFEHASALPCSRQADDYVCDVLGRICLKKDPGFRAKKYRCMRPGYSGWNRISAVELIRHNIRPHPLRPSRPTLNAMH